MDEKENFNDFLASDGSYMHWFSISIKREEYLMKFKKYFVVLMQVLIIFMGIHACFSPKFNNFPIKTINTTGAVIFTDWNPSISWEASGTPICTEPQQQYAPAICSDGAGGAIITWYDTSNIFAQRINSQGKVLWSDNGTPICTASGSQTISQIISDGYGGAIITWKDFRGPNEDIYAQRIDTNGQVRWENNGTVICNASGTQDTPQIISDGAGGAIISWQDYRNGNYDIYAQRIDSNGQNKWGNNGTAVCTDIGHQLYVKMCSDGAGGAIISWLELVGIEYDIYVQHISYMGGPTWSPNGTLICNYTGDQIYQEIVSDGEGGAIIVWEDHRGADSDIYAQYIDSTGSVQWTLNGTPICSATGDQLRPKLCSNGYGGAIITWYDMRGVNRDIYAQLINSNGITEWVFNGIPICTEIWNQEDPRICSNGAGGAIIVWEDYRSGSSWDIYTQNVDSSGNVLWAVNGTPISIKSNWQEEYAILSDEKGGAFITWRDRDGTGDYDIYAQYMKQMPVSSHPIDVTTTLGGSELIRWVLQDIFAGGKYRIWVNDTNNHYYVWGDWTSWSNNTIINVPILRDATGTYNYTIEYYNNLSQYGISDTVIVTITSDAPLPSQPGDTILISSAGGTSDSLFVLLGMGIIGTIIFLIIVAIVIARNTSKPLTIKETVSKKA